MATCLIQSNTSWISRSRVPVDKASCFFNRNVLREPSRQIYDEEKTTKSRSSDDLKKPLSNRLSYRLPLRRLDRFGRLLSRVIYMLLIWLIWNKLTYINTYFGFQPLRNIEFISEYIYKGYDDDTTNLNHLYEGDYWHQALNSTLGFQKIYVLNLDRRTDRRDAMSLMVYEEGLQVDWVSAVDGREIDPETFPLWNDTFTRGQMGCYRSHLNILRDMIDNHIQTALILQDDVDWDIGLRYSLQRLQGPLQNLLRGLNTNEKSKSTHTRRSDKASRFWNDGKDWDMLWLGAAYEQAHHDVRESSDTEDANLINTEEDGTSDPIALTPEKSYPYLVYEDERVASKGLEEQGGRNVFPSYALERWEEEGDARLRVVQKTRRALGMAGTAYSLQGAVDILKELQHGMVASFDNSVSSRGYSVWPPLFSQRRNKDGHRNSDLLEDGRPIGTFEHVQDYSLEVMESRRV